MKVSRGGDRPRLKNGPLATNRTCRLPPVATRTFFIARVVREGMRVFISADMEGVTGVATPDDVATDGSTYERGRELFVGDVNAAIEGALDAGAEDVLVNDAHSSMTNLPRDRLHEGATLIRGNTKPRSMMQGLGHDHGVACFVGYHAMAGTEAAVLNHTFVGHELLRLRVAGTETGELGWNARLAGALGVPVGLVTGDDATAAEAHTELGSAVETVAVKRAIDRFSAACRPPEEARAAIRAGAAAAVEAAREGTLEPTRPAEPATIEADWSATNHAARAGALPGVSRPSARTTAVTADDYSSAYEGTVAMLRAGIAGRDERYG